MDDFLAIHATASGLRSILVMLGAHTDTLLLTHVIWATRDRLATLEPAMDTWLAATITEICRAIGCDLLAVGNSKDHVHVVLRQPPSASLAQIVGRMKGASSHAWNARSPDRRLRWQTGYWGRSVEQASLDPLAAYVGDQRKRHHTGATTAAWEQNEATSRVE